MFRSVFKPLVKIDVFAVENANTIPAGTMHSCSSVFPLTHFKPVPLRLFDSGCSAGIHLLYRLFHCQSVTDVFALAVALQIQRTNPLNHFLAERQYLDLMIGISIELSGKIKTQF